MSKVKYSPIEKLTIIEEIESGELGPMAAAFNSPMESFWGTLKCEKYNLQTYRTFDELEQDIEGYIHFYNYERFQAKLNGLSPMELRTKAV
ncbi:IS3 family transposase [Paenibacillus sp. 2TAB26]|uniref:IS3 family transposase n=1 Tax=Paenibacillus sp. 2TAB26 TaxID=3233005 RepID=UPI003F998144